MVWPNSLFTWSYVKFFLLSMKIYRNYVGKELLICQQVMPTEDLVHFWITDYNGCTYLICIVDQLAAPVLYIYVCYIFLHVAHLKTCHPALNSSKLPQEVLRTFFCDHQSFDDLKMGPTLIMDMLLMSINKYWSRIFWCCFTAIAMHSGYIVLWGPYR